MPINATVSTIGAYALVRISGAIDSHAAGPLHDVLVGAIEGDARRLIVDLSGVAMVTRAGAGVLVVAAKLLESRRGALRLCGASADIRHFLRGMGFDHLLHCDATPADSVIALAALAGARRRIVAGASTGAAVRTTRRSSGAAAAERPPVLIAKRRRDTAA